jgi:hypothetical protein
MASTAMLLAPGVFRHEQAATSYADTCVRHQVITSEKVLLFGWFLCGSAYVIFRFATNPTVPSYLTYWCFVLEMLILLYIALWELVIAVDCLAAAHPMKYARHERWLVAFVGVYVGSANMVFVGSVYISVDAAVTLAPLIAVDGTMALSNLVTHTLPWCSALLLISAYRHELRRSLAHARWFVFYARDPHTCNVFPEMRDTYAAERYWRLAATRGVGDLGVDKPNAFAWRTAPWAEFVASKYPGAAKDARFKTTSGCVAAPAWLRAMADAQYQQRIALDLVHFWGPLVVPGIWLLLSNPDDTYDITLTPVLYLLTIVSLLGPSIMLVLIARYNARSSPKAARRRRGADRVRLQHASSHP